MDAIQFDQLPDLCLRKIFALLGLRDLVKCRAVSRQFKHYADRTKATELVVDEYKSYSYRSGNWYLTDRPIDFEGAISLKAFKSAESSPFKLDQQLKFLHISLCSVDPVCEMVNTLEQLIHLELSAQCSSRKATLVLPNLKVLVLVTPDSIVLKTPKLQVLSCSGIHRIQFEYPETIKRVECQTDSDRDYEVLAKLGSMEVLCVDLHLSGDPQANRLLNLTSLKELHLKFDLRRISDRKNYVRNYEFRRSILNILHERSALQRDELKLYMNEVRLVDAKQPAFDPLFPGISRFPDDDDRLIKVEDFQTFKFVNYRLLLRDSYPEVTSLDFNQLMKLDFEISEDFFDRFPRIQSLMATDLFDREQFEWFLQNATALRELKLIDTRLDQAFIDRLPKLSSRLTHLEFYGSSGLISNFQFLLQLEHLEAFETDLQLHSFDLAAAAFQQSSKLMSLQCRTSSAFVEIERSSALEDNYTLRFFRIRSQPGQTIETNETFCQENLTWAQLEALYHSRSSDTIDAPEKSKMRIKRARLE